MEILSILVVPLCTDVILSYVHDVFFCFVLFFYCIYCILYHVQVSIDLNKVDVYIMFSQHILLNFTYSDPSIINLIFKLQIGFPIIRSKIGNQ